MNPRPLLAALAASLLALPSAAAGPGSATACNDLGTACATATLTPALLSCADVSGVWTCDVAWTLRLDLAGVTCGWGWASEMGEASTCNVLPQGSWFVLTVPRAYAVPAGGSTVTSDATVCVDHLTPLQRCAQYQASIDLPGP